ncbi:MAG: thiol reductant ABC exporter subunit CydD [Chloroflexota bacterium]
MNRRLLNELHTVRASLWASIGLSVALGSTVIIQGLLLSRIINRVFLENGGVNTVSEPLLQLAIVIAIRAALSFGSSFAAAEMAIRVKADIRQRLITHLIRLGPTYFKSERSGELTITATEGIEALDAFYRDFIPGLIAAVVIPLLILIVVLPIDILTFSALFVTAPLIPLFMALIGMAAGELARKQFIQMRRLGAHFLDVMQGLVTLKLFNRSLAQTQSIAYVTDQFRQATMRVLRVTFLSTLTLEMLATLSIAIVAVEIGVRLLNGGIRFEQALFLLVIAPEFYLPLRTLGAKFHAGTESNAAAAEIYRVLDTPLPQARYAAAVAIPTVMNIQFRNVSFDYDDGARPALKGITLDIQSGQKVALVGASGSGKSTVANLLLGFLQPREGQITVDNINLATLDADQWRAQVAWVPQGPYLFNATIAENIRLGQADASLEQVVQAAYDAGAHEFISQFPEGYATRTGERGLRLSGGQAQRIAIARAFLKNAPLLILDEATANLDLDNEAIIQTALRKLLQNRTTLIIAHRLNTIIDADRIYVLEGGQVVETGTHSELLARASAYHRLIQAFGENDLVV